MRGGSLGFGDERFQVVRRGMARRPASGALGLGSKGARCAEIDLVNVEWGFVGVEHAWRAGEGRLQLDRGRPAMGEERSPGMPRRNRCGGGGVDDVDAVGAFADTQCDPYVQVGAHVCGDGATGALGGEDEVHAQRPTDSRQPHKACNEFGQFLCEDAELVDDDEETRQRRGTLRWGGSICRVGVVPGGSQRVLASFDLRLERGQSPFREGVVEVGHETDDLGSVDERAEGGSALVVDEQCGDVARSVECEQATQVGEEELGLACSRGAGHEGVWPRTDEVEVDGAGCPEPDRDGGGRSGRPCPGDVCRQETVGGHRRRNGRTRASA